MHNRRFISLIVLLAFIALACNQPSLKPGGANPTSTPTPLSNRPTAMGVYTQSAPVITQSARSATPAPTRPAAKPRIYDLVFCTEFNEKTGAPIDPSDEFPENTFMVVAIFKYENMRDGLNWSLKMTRDGKPMSGIEQEVWEDGENGWVAYDLSEELSYNPMAGEYEIQLVVEGAVLAKGSFSVAAPVVKSTGFPAFGPITFSLDITEENAPIDAGTEFKYGVKQIYASFAYVNMEPGQAFSRQWLFNGKETARRDLEWDEEEDGVTYAYLQAEGNLSAGKYTLNLYLDNQLARSADFVILPPPTPATPTEKPNVPSRPDEVIDSSLMPTYQVLATFDRESVRWLAAWVLEHHVKIKLESGYTGLAAWSYDCTTTPPKYAGDVGYIKVSPSFFKKTTRVELAGVLAHEITHAMQRVQGKKCGCTVEKEYQAYSVQGGFWVLAGAQELLYDYVGKDIFDASGKFDKNKFWYAVKKIYSHCPDY
ncbi:MAG TPA: hypothetical protein VIO61_13685 [Anaerolineaceae bacterium]